MSGLNSAETKLSCKVGGSTFTELAGLIEVPELGGEKEKIDVTTLADTVKKNIFGITDYGDLQFTFLYDNSATTSNYRVLKGYADGEDLVDFEIEYPDGTTHDFSAYVSVKMGGASVNSALQFTLTLALQSAIVTVNPV